MARQVLLGGFFLEKNMLVNRSKIPHDKIIGEGKVNQYWAIEFKSFDGVLGGTVLCPESNEEDSETFTKDGKRYTDDPYKTWYMPRTI